jgi:hypothetical protein
VGTRLPGGIACAMRVCCWADSGPRRALR